jgi:3-hydroxybutyryl-CoA dehydrogenase
MTINETKIGVIGAGTMGAGIAQIAAQAGFETLLYDVSQEFIDRGLERIRDSLRRFAARGKITAAQEKEILARLVGSLKLEDFSASALVIEAAPEKLDLKRDLFRKLEAACPPETLLATNTSSLSVTAIAGATRSPERVLGMHFFNPPPLMALVEVVRGEQTSPAVVERALGLARQMGKTPVTAKDTPGFIVNRIARSFYNEALRILSENQAQVQTVDRVMKGAGGFPMGPFELMDLIGIDVNFAATQSLYEASFHDSRFRPNPIQQRMVEAGTLGRKSGRGFYTYGQK